MRLAHDVRAQEIAEEGELGVARCGRSASHVINRTVMFAKPNGAVRRDERFCQVAAFVLDHRQLAHPVFEGCLPRQSLGQPLSDAIADLLPTSDEDLLDEILAPDRFDGREKAAGEAAIVGRKELLRVRGHVVQVAWAPDAVLLRRVVDEPSLLEGVQLLEHARPARAEGFGERVGRRRAGLAEMEQDRPPQRRR